MLEASKRTHDWLKENLLEVWDKEVLLPNSPDCNHLDYFVSGVSKLMIKAKPQNKTEDLILKIKEVMVWCPSTGTPWRRHSSGTCSGSRLLSPLTAILLDKLMFRTSECSSANFFYFNKIR